MITDRFGPASRNKMQDVADYVHSMCDQYNDEFCFGFRGMRKKADVRNCTCPEVTLPCACEVSPCICFRRGQHSFSFMYAPAITAPLDMERAVFNYICPPTRYMCDGTDPVTGKLCEGNYRAEFTSLSFVGSLFFVVLEKGRTRRQPKIKISQSLRFGDGLSLHLAAVCVHASSHYYTYGRVRNRRGVNRWVVYDDLVGEGEVRDAPAGNDSPWESSRGSYPRLAVYVPQHSARVPTPIDLRKYAAFNHV